MSHALLLALLVLKDDTCVSNRRSTLSVSRPLVKTRYIVSLCNCHLDYPPMASGLSTGHDTKVTLE
jgi:hypothetical protein